MNKDRIRKLKHQASLWCDENIPDQYSEETNGYGSAWEDKLAELIVRECAKIAEKEQEFGNQYKLVKIGTCILIEFGL